MNQPKYWRGLEELELTPEFIEQANKEFPTDISLEDALANTSDESLNVQSSRRGFLKMLGFGMTAATLAACAEGPTKKAIPWVVKPDDIIPGVPNWYASTANGLPVIVKTREGRPIKLEGNPDSPLTKGGLDAITHASLLNLYDEDRLRAPLAGTNSTTWDKIDEAVAQKLTAIRTSGGKVRVLTGTLNSPTALSLAGNFLGSVADGKHVAYDALSVSAIAKAHSLTHGKRAVPSYQFDKAKVIASFGADFLGTWINPVVYSSQYVQGRDSKGEMSRHFQFESIMTITGAKADLRFPVQPSQIGLALANLYNKVASKLGKGTLQGVTTFNVAMNGLDKAADDLVKHAGSALVVCGVNDVALQVITNALNNMLGAYGTTVDLVNHSNAKTGDDEALAALIREMEAGEVSALILSGVNPVYDSPYGEAFANALKKVSLSVAISHKANETTELCTYTGAASHYLESWGDAQQTASHYSLQQPTISKIFDTRQFEECLMRWMGVPGSYADFLKNYWQSNLTTGEFTAFWNETLRKGITVRPATGTVSYTLSDADLQAQADKAKGKSAQGMELVAYAKVAIGDGTWANNPWLQEMPDPVSRATWDNYVTLPVTFAKEIGVLQDDVVKVTVNGKEVYLPVVVSPGQAQNTIGIALGYGSKGGKVTDRANGSVVNNKKVGGANAYALLTAGGEAVSYTTDGVKVEKTGDVYKLALVQTFNTLYDPAKLKIYGSAFDRTDKIVEETTTAELKNGVYAGRVEKREEIKSHLVNLWDSHYKDPETNRTIHWKMVIDLNKCTGCGACVVSCQAENNIPVVGKEEVRIRREMHWMRIDRYFAGDPNDPDVVFQPMLCQHCDNAPCETVCPVLATIHSDEGMNQMSYNRCVGTRYCANNCPYKVRRFNWFNYYNDKPKFGDLYTHSDLGRLVLNPDVTVRYRGVMEKCSFCVQRLQDAKLRAKLEAKSTFGKPADGDIKTACQQSCPTGAISFGDFNDPNSEVSRLYREDRGYHALEEVKTLPNVKYLALIRNRSEEEHKAKRPNTFESMTFTQEEKNS